MKELAYIPVLMFLLAAAGHVHADEPLGIDSITQETLQPLDARVEDMTALSMSLRVESPGLAVPSDFDEVYRVPGDPSKLMRVNGALYAVFDQSVYGNYKGHVYARVPPATVFHIGAPPNTPGPNSPIEPAGSMRAEKTEFTRAGFGFVVPVEPSRHSAIQSDAERAEEPLPRFVADQDYRKKRLRELLERRIKRSNDQ